LPPPEKALDYLVLNAFKAMINRPASFLVSHRDQRLDFRPISPHRLSAQFTFRLGQALGGKSKLREYMADKWSSTVHRNADKFLNTRFCFRPYPPLYVFSWIIRPIIGRCRIEVADATIFFATTISLFSGFTLRLRDSSLG
jgi:hypothetical protein